jgi:hypothetical protein
MDNVPVPHASSAVRIAIATWVVLVLSACDPTDPAQNGVSYWLMNPTGSPVVVSWCDQTCTDGESGVPEEIAPHACLLMTVGTQSTQTGDRYAVADPSGRRLGFVFVQPTAGRTFSVTPEHATEAEAVASPALSAEGCPST